MNSTDKAVKYLEMEMCMKVIGLMVNFKEKEFSLDKMVLLIRVNGSTIYRMVMAIKNGPTEPSMKEVLLIVTSKAMEYSKRRMEASMKDNLKRIKSKAMVTLCGQTEVNTKAFGRMTR